LTVKNSPYIGVDGFPISPQVGRIVTPQVIIEEAIVATNTSQTAQALKEWVARHCHRAYGSTSANLHRSHNLRFSCFISFLPLQRYVVFSNIANFRTNLTIKLSIKMKIKVISSLFHHF
jgi:hypothetical protein